MNKQRKKVFLTFRAPTGGARKKKKITRKLLSKLDPSHPQAIHSMKDSCFIFM